MMLLLARLVKLEVVVALRLLLVPQEVMVLFQFVMLLFQNLVT